ncbi:MAG: hypothetical protein Kow0042_20030 [Calditrichia bacterium]
MKQGKSFLRKVNSAFYTVRDFIVSFRKILLIWLGLTLFVVIGVAVGLDEKVVAFLAIVFGLLSQAFIGLLNLIALIPVVGPLIAKVLALPFYWLLNALGYFVSVIAIKKGFSREVLNYRVLTIVFLVGIVVGFLIGKLI